MNKRLALKNCHIIHGDSNKSIADNMTILINENGIIEHIGKTKELKISKNYKTINLAGKYVMPGLINAHVHLFSDGKPFTMSSNESMLKTGHKLLDTKMGRALLKKRMKRNALNALHAGITTMRSVGEFFYTDVHLRDEIKANKFIGPNLLVSGYFLSVTGGHGAPYLALVSDSPWEGRKNVRINSKHGVDLIKICVTGGVTDAKAIGEAGRLQMTEEEVTAICDEAHKMGLLVAAHAESTEGVRIALKGGVDTIEHGAEMDEEIIALYQHNPKALRGYSALIPTCQAGYPVATLDSAITKVKHVVKENSKLVYEGMMVSLKQAITNHIKIGVGTDAAMPYVTHYDLWRELNHFLKYTSLSPNQVIECVTKSNAEILGIDHITGTVDIGKQADLIVLERNPLEAIQTLSEVKMVLIKGHLIKNPTVSRINKVDKLLNSKF